MKRNCSSQAQEHEPKERSTGNEKSLNLSSLSAPVSPPQKRFHRSKENTYNAPSTPNLAAIEAGEEQVTDHLGIISTRLAECIRPPIQQSTPRLAIDEWVNLYKRNEHPHGRHFVIHQHDHPVAGPHYDLRLQFSETSSVSWSVMYGMPGDPNSQRLNRNATETRIHCLWNHLIETASTKTGSMIIWDTGEYEILPYHPPGPETDDSHSDISESPEQPDSTKLQEAFKNRKIRLRLHGTRLPRNYTLLLRMDKSTDYTRPVRQGPKRRRKSKPRAPSSTSADSDSDLDLGLDLGSDKAESTIADPDPQSATDDVAVDLEIQINNAYPGSSNTIGSIHQRRWWISLDRSASGFHLDHHGHVDKNDDGNGGGSSERRTWVRSRMSGQGYPFYVHGPGVERSVVTGRLGADVLDDEAVVFVPRRGWRAVLN